MDCRYRRSVSVDSGLNMNISWPSLSTVAVASSLNSSMSSADACSARTSTDGTQEMNSSQEIDSGVSCSCSHSSSMEDQNQFDDDNSPLGRNVSTLTEAAASLTYSEAESSTCVKMDTEVMSSGEDSPDCPESLISQAVQPSYSTLVEIISNQVDVDQFASELYSGGLIRHEVLVKVQTTLGIAKGMKASELLHPVMSKLRLCKESDETHMSFVVFIKVLDKYPCFFDIAAKIKTKYKELLEKKPLEYGTSSNKSKAAANDHDQKQAVKRRARGRTWQYAGLCILVIAICIIPVFLLLSVAEVYINCHQSSENLDTQSIVEKKLHHRGVKVDELLQEMNIHNQELDKLRNEANKVLEAQLRIARKQILQLNKEVISLKRPQPQACATTCQYRIEYEKLKRKIKRIEEEKLEYIATIENLTQQREMLLAA